MGLILRALDKNSLKYVWYNMREYDWKELVIQSYTRDEALNLIGKPYSYCLYSDNSYKPVACGGILIWSKPIKGSFRTLLWGFGTDEADKYMISITKFTKSLINRVEKENWQYLTSVLIWEGHEKSISWLKALGFENSLYSAIGLNNERVFLMERAKICVVQQR